MAAVRSGQTLVEKPLDPLQSRQPSTMVAPSMSDADRLASSCVQTAQLCRFPHRTVGTVGSSGSALGKLVSLSLLPFPHEGNSQAEEIPFRAELCWPRGWKNSGNVKVSFPPFYTVVLQFLLPSIDGIS
jgi:hypothetical protein